MLPHRAVSMLWCVLPGEGVSVCLSSVSPTDGLKTDKSNRPKLHEAGVAASHQGVDEFPRR